MNELIKKITERKAELERRLEEGYDYEGTMDYAEHVDGDAARSEAYRDEITFLASLLDKPKPKLKFRIEAKISNLIPGFPSDVISEKRWTDTYFAVDEKDLLAQANDDLHDEKGNPYTYTITWFPYWFECEIRSVKNLKWWEENAIRAVQNFCSDHDRLDISMDELAHAMYDSWDEDCWRDGEPGPKAGNVDFEKDERSNFVTIRSRRVLAIVRLVKGPGYVEKANDDDNEE